MKITNKIPYLYILQSLKDKKLYIGYSNNIIDRFRKHKNGKVRATSYRRPFKVVYLEKCKDKYEGRKREKYFKTLYATKEKKKLIT